MALGVDRKQILAYRVVQHGLLRDVDDLARLSVFDIGVQDTPPGSLPLALAARIRGPVDKALTSDDFALVWSLRGAPHLHRSSDLRKLATALLPLSDEDAIARLAGAGRDLKKSGVPGREALARAAREMRAVVTRPMTKGEVSAAVTKRVPAELATWCRGCNATHIFESLFRLAALPAGLQIERRVTPLTFTRIKAWRGVPSRAAGSESLVTAYLRLLGPATRSEAAAFLGTTGAEVSPAWPRGELEEVSIRGKTAWLPEARADDLRVAKPARIVRLLPPSDPFLQGRDRNLLVPNKAHHKKLWRILGSPGALLVDGEIAGAWRGRMAGKTKLVVTVEPFTELSKRVRSSIDEESGRMAEVRGASSVEFQYGTV